MKNNELLKELILTKERSITAYAKRIGIKQTTLNSILMRGIEGATAENIYKICYDLQIDFFSLMQGEIKEYKQNINFDNYEITFVNKLRLLPNEEKEELDTLLSMKCNKILKTKI